MERKTVALFVFAGGLAFATAVGAQAPSSTPSGSTMPSSAAPKTGAMTSGKSASDTGKMQSSAKSATGVNASATASALADLKMGQTVKDSTGTTIGTVSRIQKSKDGTVRAVHVASASGGKTMQLAPGTLSVSNGVVTTTAMPKSK